MKNKLLKSKLMKKHVQKLGNTMVFFTLLKGFIGTGILFLPNGFHNAGWGFAIGSLLFSMIITLSWMWLLIIVSNKVEGSFSELGMKALGPTGKYMWDLTLAVSQAGFVTAGSVFVYQNMGDILSFRLGMEIKHWWIGLFWFFVYAPLTWVRRLQKFAKFHVFADVTILTALFVILCYTCVFYGEAGKFSSNVKSFNRDNYLIFVGTAIYAFEGVGIVLPVKDACQFPKDYLKVLCLVLAVVASIYLGFGGFNYFVYGSELLSEAPLITRLMPQGSIPFEIVMVMFTINIFISYPLVIHPTNMVLESYIFKGMEQSPMRKWLKNINRTVVAALTVWLGLYLEDTLDRLMSVIGSLACTPVAFILPALLHLKLAATTTLEKLIDYVIVVVGIFLMVFITGYTLNNWS